MPAFVSFCPEQGVEPLSMNVVAQSGIGAALRGSAKNRWRKTAKLGLLSVAQSG